MSVTIDKLEDSLRKLIDTLARAAEKIESPMRPDEQHRVVTALQTGLREAKDLLQK